VPSGSSLPERGVDVVKIIEFVLGVVFFFALFRIIRTVKNRRHGDGE
jgi:hypothetical protein